MKIQPSTPSMRKVALASLMGSVIEFYDFVIYGQAAAMVFGDIFFPGRSPLAGVLASFATFAVGFFFRPVGGMVFGHFGDRIGRKTILYITLLLTGGATVLMGLLPTYQAIGVAAPIALVTLRIVQGIGVGGEWGGAALTVVEHSPKTNRSFWGSVIQTGSSAGLVVGTTVITLTSLLTTEDQFQAWGWRIPFLFSLVLVAAGLYIRAQIPETPDIVALKEQKAESGRPLLEAIRTRPKNIALAACITGTSAVPFYTVSVFTLAYGTDRVNISKDTMAMFLLVAATFTVGAIPMIGLVARRWGARRVLLVSICGVGICGFPYFAMLNSGRPWMVLLAMVVVLALFQGGVYAPQASFFPGLFEARFRYSGTGLAYNLGTMVFGGLTPFIATALYAVTDKTWPIAAYMLGVAMLSFICTLLATDNFYDRRDFTPAPASSPVPQTPALNELVGE